jgi:hypothetical protein
LSCSKKGISQDSPPYVRAVRSIGHDAGPARFIRGPKDGA